MTDELDATTDVVTLAEHVDGFGTDVACRLEDHGFETIADILIADEGALTDVPYVSDLRADTLREAAGDVVDEHVEPRDVDFDATESVVSEAAIPLSVRRGEAVLTSRTTSNSYHTTACRNVRKDSNLAERSWKYVDTHDLEECEYCSGEWSPGIRGDTTANEDIDPLESNPVANALDVGLGEKVELVTEGGRTWSQSWCVVDVDEPVSWTAPLGEDFETRSVTIRPNPQSGKQYDLLVTGDEVWMAGEYNGQPYQRLWRVEQVNPIGRIAQSSYYQLIGQQREEQNTRPEGDDTWRQYQNRGETA